MEYTTYEIYVYYVVLGMISVYSIRLSMIICTRLLAYWTPISWRYQMLADLFELYEVIQSYTISMLCRNLLSLNSADAIFSRVVLLVRWDI